MSPFPYRLVHLLLVAAACFPSPTHSFYSSQQLECRELNIKVAARSVNNVFPSNLTIPSTPELIPDFLSSIESAGTAVVDGTYRIAARFCSPLHDVPERRQTLQILVHGVTYTKEYWSGPSSQIGPFSTNQSWVHHAVEQGYYVLAVDRVCSGQSSRLDSIQECQLPLEAAILDKLIQTARDGALPGLAIKFGKIIYVGHSYGSMIGNWIAQSNPVAVDQLHLTGFTENLFIGSPSILLRPAWLPAALHASARFSGLDLGYLIATDREGSESHSYTDEIDPAVLSHAWETRGVVTVGELLTGLLGQGPAPEYRGDVFVVNGDEDALFCASDPVTSATGKLGACESRQTSEHVALDYPAARRFGYLNLPNTGHSLGLHRSASQAIAASHRFMAESGF